SGEGRPPATQKSNPAPSSDRRDHDVMEIVVRDLLDPNNPEYNLDAADKAHWPKQIVLNTVTYTCNDDITAEEALDIVASERGLSKELTRNWKRRNSGKALSTSRFKIRDKNVRFADIARLIDESDHPLDFAKRFRKLYPDALFFVCPFLPS